MKRLESLFCAFIIFVALYFVIGALKNNFYFGWDRTLFPNSNFEKGILESWMEEGVAFHDQPTFGDNTYYRGRGVSNFRGNYWIGTYENRHSSKDPKGEIQGDAPVGKLTSIPFIIERDRICFLIGGGNNSAAAGVTLEVEGKRVLFEPGRGSLIDSERMSRVTWDVSRWKGKKARIVIEDNSGEGWVHINVDDFRYTIF